MATRIKDITPRLPGPFANKAATPPGASFRAMIGRLATDRPEASERPRGASPPAVISSIHRTVASIERQRATIDQAIARAARGHEYTASELLLLQSRVYAYSQDMEVISRLVDRVVSSVKTTLNTQL